MSKLTIAEKLNRKKTGLPPAVLYWPLLKIWQLIFNRKLGVKFTYNARPNKEKGPYVLISNHASRVDYLFTAPAVFPHRLNYVVGYNEFYRSHLSLILSIMQVIPKRNFTPDVHAIREIKRVIKKGGRVCFMPEGMSSISGGNQPSALGTGKLLKHLGVPVYYTVISGGYLTYTKHCLDERPGKVEITVDRLFTAEDLKTLSPDEIQAKVDEAIRHDDYEWNLTAKASFDGKGEMAKNFGDLLYLCPRCGAKFTMKGEGDRLICSECGNGATVDSRYTLTPLDDDCVIPETVSKWYALERERAKQDVADPDFSYSEKVKLGTLPKYKTLKNQETSIVTGEGTLSISREGLKFSGTNNGEPFEFSMPTDLVPTYGMCTDITRFYTFCDSEFYEFYPERNDVMYWFHVTEELHRANGGKWKYADSYLEKDAATV